MTCMSLLIESKIPSSSACYIGSWTAVKVSGASSGEDVQVGLSHPHGVTFFEQVPVSEMIPVRARSAPSLGGEAASRRFGTSVASSHLQVMPSGRPAPQRRHMDRDITETK